MLKKTTNKDFDKYNKLRQDLDSIIESFKTDDPAKILKFSYSNLSDYFKNIQIKSLNKRKEEMKFPGKPSDYTLTRNAIRDNKLSIMHDSFPLFYMEGIYRNRHFKDERDYLGVKISGKIIPAAYIQHIKSRDYKIYLDYNILKNVDNEMFKRLIAAASILLSEYKNKS